ncbi:MAG: hypothetical protein JRL30_25975 [Deltaproteobacteria bacterium]|nr:hypothetical protein [Deltaproteobacteria bacterium]
MKFPEKKTILEQVKKNKSTIYGGQAIKKRIGLFARPTQDFDILSKKPKKAANQLTNALNRIFKRRKPYFMKPAMHPGTFKVKHRGMDRRKNTQDDLEVADFTKPTRKHKTSKIDGVDYVALSEVVKDKKSSLGSEEFAFRHQKDQDDLNRIKLAKQVRKW